MSEHARRSKRYPSKHQLLVQCDSWSEFAQLYATDVSQGGMFIITDEAPPILSEIGIALRLPEGHEITFKASVVHVIDAEQAARDKREAGVGVQFIDLDSVRKQQIQQLVEFSRWEGAADNPTATYASRLFEVSASLPPSKVLDALPAELAGTELGASSVRAGTSTQPGSLPARAKQSEQPAGRADGNRTQGPRGASASSAGSSGDELSRTSSDAAPPREDQPAAAVATPGPPKATDIKKLKLAMTHLAHKDFAQAIKAFEELVKENPGDKQSQQWLHIANARLRLKQKDTPGALEHYGKALEVSEDNHEARKFVREHHVSKRLNSLPFGRYFVKKP